MKTDTELQFITEHLREAPRASAATDGTHRADSGAAVQFEPQLQAFIERVIVAILVARFLQHRSDRQIM